ncbi:MAG: ABC transporter substrate-binding protein [Sphaerochaeta sp.]
MKRFTVVLLMFLLVGTFVFAAPQTETKTGKIGDGRTLVVGVWGGPQEEIIREHVVKKFEEETGAKVEFVLGGSSDRYARIYSELNNPSMDVVYLSMAQTEQANKDGVILAPNPQRVPEYNNLYPIAKGSGGYGVALMAIGLMYNTDRFKTPPDSWLEMWKPENKGKVAPFVFPGTQGTAFLVMAAKVHGGSETNIAPGFDAIKQLKPFPMILSGIDEMNLAFQQGDIWLAPQMDGYAYNFKDAGGPVDFILPKEGAVLSMNCAAVTKNTKNADLAEMFINIHLSQDCQEAYAEVLKYGPTNKNVKLSENLGSKVVYGDAAVAKLYALDNASVTKNQSAWADRWNKEILEK